MHNDEVVWQVLGNNFCSYKAKILNDTFCRNPYNVTGLCNKVSCPLSNGYYATVIEEDGTCYLCLKTIERAHLPRMMWERIELSSNYQKALEQITIKMKNVYKDHQIHRCKQRFTRLRQTLTRMRQMQLEPEKNLVAIKKKTERREEARERKAQIAAKLDVSIEQELLQRLKQGVYGDIYNHDRKIFESLLDEKKLLEQTFENDPTRSEELLDTQHTVFVEDETESDASFNNSESDEEINSENDFLSDANNPSDATSPHTPLDVEELHQSCNAQMLSEQDAVSQQTLSNRQKRTSRPLLRKISRTSYQSHQIPRVEVEYEYQTEAPHVEH